MDSIVMIGRYQRWVQAISPAPQAAKSLQRNSCTSFIASLVAYKQVTFDGREFYPCSKVR